MHKKHTLILGVLALVLGSSGLTGTEAVGLSASTGLWSRYLWRGLRFSNGAVWQSNLACTYKAFTGSVWTNYDFKTDRLNEVDPTLNWAWTLGKVSMNAGWTHFGVLRGRDNDELYLSATLGECPLSPTLTWFQDMDYGKGSYAQLTLTHSFTLSPKLHLNLSANGGVVFKDRYMGLNAKGEEFTDLFSADLTASLPIALSDKVTLEPKLGYAFPLSSQGREAISSYGFGTRGETLFGALVLNASF